MPYTVRKPNKSIATLMSLRSGPLAKLTSAYNKPVTLTCSPSSKEQSRPLPRRTPKCTLTCSQVITGIMSTPVKVSALLPLVIKLTEVKTTSQVRSPTTPLTKSLPCGVIIAWNRQQPPGISLTLISVRLLTISTRQ